ncbi:GPALPP motifs-containing protein 1 [Nymphon striatum]|nr:GPALPP motifs-containing protein 1 [Nymphon striatum]
MDEFIGPVFPPNIKPSTTDSSSDSEDEIDSVQSDLKVNIFGPMLPSTVETNIETQINTLGPQLPPNLKDSSDSKTVEIEDKDDNSSLFGPKLPPNLKADCKEHTRVVGPQLPPGICLPSEDYEEEGEDDENFIGPFLPNAVQSNTSNKSEEFERRSQKMKDKLAGKTDNIVQRESWMTELPENDKAKSFGLGARTFKRRAPDVEVKDRSDWTDTPADRQKKSKNKDSQKKTSSPDTHSHRKRDKEIEKYVSEHNTKSRSESLVDMHKTKMKKTKTVENEPKQRQPFDREKDLQVNRFDEAQKKSLMKKAQELNSRFSHSKVTSNFL